MEQEGVRTGFALQAAVPGSCSWWGVTEAQWRAGGGRWGALPGWWYCRWREACLTPGPAYPSAAVCVGWYGKARPPPSGLCPPIREGMEDFSTPPLCWEWRWPPGSPVEGWVSFLQELLIEHLLYACPGARATVVSMLDVLCPLRGRVEGFGPHPWGGPPAPRRGLSC